MAHVAISRDFIQRVETKISKMRQAELNALGQEPQISLSPESPVLLNAVWGEYLHLRSQLPKKWKDMNGNVRLTFDTTTIQEKVDTTNGAVVHEPITCQFTVSASADERYDLPPNSYWHGLHKIKDEDMTNPDIRKAVDIYLTVRPQCNCLFHRLT